ncbi:hypothetical protein BKA70DRAFT_1569416 [Coprinopsis sp. MPI-PUGE-AT-0042]|nr:hypothetical protein BKA70DRAFT_1569416 [Coprinopsis sp. MPI-PUGE-AT-0042]
MQFRSAFLCLASFLAFAALPALAGEGDVHTATITRHALVKESPFIVNKFQVTTWTQGPSITDSVEPTPIPSTNVV